MKSILLGVSGSIAAYKSAEIVNKLKSDYQIKVVMTKAATNFITPLTLQTLSQAKVHTNLFDEEVNISHIDLVKNSDVILVAPATANIISKMANGICDDLLSTILLVADPQKVIIAPAMNTRMYENKIIVENIHKLKKLGVRFVQPRESLLACQEYGKGALATVEDIQKVVNKG